MKSKAKGFSLIEIMVVVFILGLLASALAPGVIEAMFSGRLAKATSDLSAIDSAVKMYRLDYGRYPSQEIGLDALLHPPQSKRGLGITRKRYLSGSIVDPWDNQYIYSLSDDESEFTLLSLGADGLPGGSGENADIVRGEFND